MCVKEKHCPVRQTDKWFVQMQGTEHPMGAAAVQGRDWVRRQPRNVAKVGLGTRAEGKAWIPRNLADG